MMARWNAVFFPFFFFSRAQAELIPPNICLFTGLPRKYLTQCIVKSDFLQTQQMQSLSQNHISLLLANSWKRGEVMLFFVCTRPCLVFDTVQSMGHWRHKILTHHRKCSEGKRCSVGLTLILSDVRTPGGEDVTSIAVYLCLPSWAVVSHFHLMCCCDLNG